MLLALVVVAFVHGIIGPDFFSLTVLEIVLPFTLVPGTVLMDVDAIAVGLVVEPLALENVAVHVPEFSIAAGLVEPPVALVFGAVLPDLDAVSVLQVSEPLANICCAIFKMNFWSLLQLRLIYLPHGELVVELPFEDIVAAHVVVVLRVQLAELRSNSLTGHDTARPCLQANDKVNVLLEVHL